MKFFWLIILVGSIQISTQSSWEKHKLPLEGLGFEDLFPEEFFDLALIEEYDEPVPSVLASHVHELPLGELQPSLSSYSTSPDEPWMRPPVISVANTITGPYPTQPAFQTPPSLLNETTSNDSEERAVWFSRKTKDYDLSQDTLRAMHLPVVFSQRYYLGAMGSKKESYHMCGKNNSAGYRVSQDKILVLDGWGDKSSAYRNRAGKWYKHDFNEITLKTEEFRRMGYPLMSDGLVVALIEGSRLTMASYGKPPLGAVLLRPKGKILKFIGRSSDDNIKALDVQNHDIVIVGSLDRISGLESGTIQLAASSTPDVIAATIYNSTNEITICIVATISTTRNLKPKKDKREPRPPPGLGRKKVKNATSPSSNFEPSVSLSNDEHLLSQADNAMKDKRHRPAVVTRQKKSKPGLVTQQSPSSPDRAERAIWFQKKRGDYDCSQDRIPNPRPSIVFSQRCYRGIVKPKDHPSHIEGTNILMGYRVNEDRIMALNVYGGNDRMQNKRIVNWKTSYLSEATLESKAFRGWYPKLSDGLVVALSKENQLLMASYGKPPLGATLLRPKGEILKFIDCSSDDTVKALEVRDGDIVVVGPLAIMSELESGTIQLAASSTPDVIAATIYNSTSDMSICIVASISTNQAPPPAIEYKSHNTPNAISESARQRNVILPKALSQVSSQSNSGLVMPLYHTWNTHPYQSAHFHR